MPARRLVLALVCLLTIAPAGCGPLTQPPAVAELGGASEAAALLESLTVAAWGSMAGYRRDLFPHWSAQGDGCDTRDRVLQRDGRDVRSSAGCEITRGSWFSPYDGRTATDPGEIDIDHLVPLANAWRTGAAGWTEDAREEFANDLVRPQLAAVTAATNRAKGDQDPSQWRPPRREFWCEYAIRWIEVKSHWRLTVTAPEKAALADLLGTC